MSGPATGYDRREIVALKRAHPLARTLADYGVVLRRQGADRFLALCPFHDDRRTPNFLVYAGDPDDEYYKCYACGAYGDVLDFVAFREGFRGPEAFRLTRDFLLGRPATPPGGPRLPDGELPPAERDPRRDRQWDRLTRDQQVVMNIAADVYHARLAALPQVRAYLRRRHVPDWLARRLKIGWADGHALRRRLEVDRSGARLLAAAEELDLLRRRPDGGGELRDLMAGRIVIPELRYGHCIWHVGRSFDFDGRPSRHTCKYLCPPGERPVLGLEWCNRHPEVYIGEGVFDWLALLALELPAFCALGTALPTVGLGFLARARRVYGVFDGDRAGRDAAARYARALPGRCYPLHLPDGCKDLSELLDRADGRDRFVALVGAARCADEPAGDHAPTPAARAGVRGRDEREEEDDGATRDGLSADAAGD